MQRMDSLQNTPTYSRRRHLIPASHPRRANTVLDVNSHLQIAVNEYRTSRTDASTITLILTHGTSFCKELWQPLIDFWLREKSPLPISTILALDAVNHGDSAVANDKYLGQNTYWPDHSLDILQVLNYLGIDGPVIGVGHSFGGGTLSHASVIAPKRFATTILVEPILFQMKDQTEVIARKATQRRDRWRDLDDVLAAFASNRGMADWTTDQRERYAKYGTKIVQDSASTYRSLKTPKTQEAATYLAAPYPEILTLLSQSTSKHYFILGDRSPVLNEESRNTLKKISEKTGESFMMKGPGHLIPMTHPEALGQLIENIILKVVRGLATSRCNL